VDRRSWHDRIVKDHRYFVYIMASRTHVFYVGVTNNLGRRVREHKDGVHDGFTAQYKVNRLVYYESWHYIKNAIAREKQIKPWRREKKIRIIEMMNPTWQDLSADWGEPIEPLGNAGPSAPRPPAAKEAAENTRGRCGRDDKSM
jgi:putative endonuclease